jgi:hypothetical protein
MATNRATDQELLRSVIIDFGQTDRAWAGKVFAVKRESRITWHG